VIARYLRTSVVLAAAAVWLSGCLANTPTNVAKRFVGAVRGLNWDTMEALVDWPSSQRALGGAFQGDRRAVLAEVLEGVTGYHLSYYGEKRAKSNLLYLKVTKAETIQKTDTLARLRLDLHLVDAKTKTIEITTRKVGRTWRVVLTPNLLEGNLIEY
jgi:hypothetical protein